MHKYKCPFGDSCMVGKSGGNPILKVPESFFIFSFFYFYDKESPDAFWSQDEELSHIPKDLQNESSVNNNPASFDESRIRGYFCSETIFQFE